MAALAALFLGAWLVAAAVLFVHPREDGAGTADAVVVLAGSHSRLEPGVRLVARGAAPLLVISDGNEPGWTRANRLCAGRGEVRTLCVDPRPFSTQGEARAIARLARSRRWRRIVVVTSRYHVTRARMLFRRCTDAEVAAVAAPTSAGALALNVPWESGKLAYQLTIQRGC